MALRYDFSVQTNLGNVADPVQNQDAATKNYVDSRQSSVNLDTQGTTYTNLATLAVAAALNDTTITLTGNVVSSVKDGTQIKIGTDTTVYRATNATLSTGNTVVTVTPAVAAAQLINTQTTYIAITQTPFTDVIAGNNVNITQVGKQISIAGIPVSINGTAVNNTNLQNNSASLGLTYTVSGSNVNASIRNADVAAVADSEIASLVGSIVSRTVVPGASVTTVLLRNTSPVQMVVTLSSGSAASVASTLNGLGAAASYVAPTINGVSSLQVGSYASEGVADLDLVVNFNSGVTFSQVNTLFNGVSGNSIFYGTALAGNFIFQTAPQNSIVSTIASQLIAGTNITLSVNATTKAVTINSTGGGGGGTIYSDAYSGVFNPGPTLSASALQGATSISLTGNLVATWFDGTQFTIDSQGTTVFQASSAVYSAGSNSTAITITPALSTAASSGNGTTVNLITRTPLTDVAPGANVTFNRVGNQLTIGVPSAGQILLDSPATTLQINGVGVSLASPLNGITSSIVLTCTAQATALANYLNDPDKAGVVEYYFAGFQFNTFNIYSAVVTNTNTVTATCTSTAFPVIASGTNFIDASTFATTAFTDIVVGTGLTGTVLNNAVGNPTLTLNSTGSAVQVNGTSLTTANFVNNVASLGLVYTVNGSAVSANIRSADVISIADSEIAAKIGSVAAFNPGAQVSTSGTLILLPTNQVDVTAAGALSIWQTLTGSTASTLPTAALAPLPQYSYLAVSTAGTQGTYSTASQYNTVQVPLSGAALYFNFTSTPAAFTNTVPSNNVYYGDSTLGQTPVFNFQTAPNNAILADIAANSVSSLNTIKGDVNLVAGSGIAISTSLANKTLTISNTASGGNITGSASVLAQTAGPFGITPTNYIVNNSPGNNIFASYVLPLGAQTDLYSYGSGSGYIAGTQLIGTNPTTNSAYGNGLRYPATLLYNRTSILFTIQIKTLNFSITTTNPVTNPNNFSSWTFDFIIAAPSQVTSGRLNPTSAGNPITFFDSASDEDAFIWVINPTVSAVNTSGNTYNITLTGGVLQLLDNNQPNDYIGSNTDYALWVTVRDRNNNVNLITGTGPVSLANSSYSLLQQFFLQTTSGGGGGSAGTLQQTLNLGNTATSGASNVASLILTNSTTNKSTVISATNGVETQQLLLDGSTSGTLTMKAAATTTSYPLTFPASQGAVGSVLTNDGSGNLTFNANQYAWFIGTEQIGFEQVYGANIAAPYTAISFDNASRTFSISLANGATSYAVWNQGVRYVVSTTQSVQIPNTSGEYYITYQVIGGILTLVQSNTPYDLRNQAPVSIVYWNAGQGAQQYLADERHSVIWDWRQHQYHHLIDGAQYAGGLAITGSINGSGTSDASAQIGISDGSFFDEDIKFNLTGGTAGNFQTAIMYRIGSAWVKNSLSLFPYALPSGFTTAAYNQNNSGNWQLAAVGNNNYGVMFVCATNDINTPFIVIMGQNTYNTQGAAAATLWGDLDLTNLPFSEFVPLFQLVFISNTSYTNTVKVVQRQFTDLRGQVKGTVVSTNAIDSVFREYPQTVFAQDSTAATNWAAYVAAQSSSSAVNYNTPTPNGTAFSTSATASAGAGSVTITGDATTTFTIGTYIAFSSSTTANRYRVTGTSFATGVTTVTFTPNLVASVSSGTPCYLDNNNSQGAIRFLQLGNNLTGTFDATDGNLRIDATGGGGGGSITQNTFIPSIVSGVTVNTGGSSISSFTATGTITGNIAVGNYISFSLYPNALFYQVTNIVGQTISVAPSIVYETITNGQSIFIYNALASNSFTGISTGNNLVSQITNNNLQIAVNSYPTFPNAAVTNAPSSANDVARLVDLQAAQQGFKPQPAANVVSQSSIGTTYVNNSGISVPYATLTGTNATNSTLAIDGVTLVAGNRVLLVGQTAITGAATGVSNGIYSVTTNTAATYAVITGVLTNTTGTAGSTFTFTWTNITGASLNFTTAAATAGETTFALLARSTIPTGWALTTNVALNTVTFTSTNPSSQWSTTPTVAVTQTGSWGGGGTITYGISSATNYAAGTFVFTRSPPAPVYGNSFYISSGTIGANQVWVNTTTASPITVGTTPLVYNIFSQVQPGSVSLNLQQVTAFGATTTVGVNLNGATNTFGATQSSYFTMNAGGTPTFTATGSAATVPMSINSKGVAPINLSAQNANYLQVTGSAFGTGNVTINTTGLDSQVDLRLNSNQPNIGKVQMLTNYRNYLEFGGGSGVNYPASISVAPSSTDANVALNLFAKGTGGITMGGQSGNANYLFAFGATSGNSPKISVDGSDTVIPLSLSSKGVTTPINIGTQASNYVSVYGVAAGSNPSITPNGSDTNISLNLAGKGTSGVNAGTNYANYVTMSGVASGSSPILSVDGSDTNIAVNINGKGTSGVNLSANYANYVNVVGAAASSNPGLQAAGSDTNITLNIAGKGTTGYVNIGSNVAAQYTQIRGNTIAAAGTGVTNLNLTGGSGAKTNLSTVNANYLYVLGANAGVTPVIATDGSDTNINMAIAGKGTGILFLGTNFTNYVKITGTGSGVNPIISATGETNSSLNIAGNGTGTVSIATNRSNYLTITGTTSGTAPSITSAGADTNVNLGLRTQGTLAYVNIDSGKANYLSIRGSASGSAIVNFDTQTNGTDTRVDMQFTPFGSTATIYMWTSTPLYCKGGITLNSYDGGATQTYNAPLLAADAVTPTTTTAGTAGQVLTSRGAGNTPYWATPGGAGTYRGAFTTSTAITTGIDTLLNWPTITNSLSALSYSNGVFTANRAVTVAFSMVVSGSSLTGATEFDAWFSKNGVVGTGTRNGQSNKVSTSGTTLIATQLIQTSWTFRLAANDTIRCYTWANPTANWNVGVGTYGGQQTIVEVVEIG